MRRRDRLGAALAALGLLLVAAPVVTAGSATAAPVTLSSATLRWGINNESNNRAFAPGTFNFLSAGLVPDTGGGGQQIPQSSWSQTAGAVRVEKWNGTAWQPATWAGLFTDSSGNDLGSPTDGTFSNHSFVFTGGTGTVDPATGTAKIAWDGDLTVVYYSGYSFFYVSDPVLEVTGGVGKLTVTVSGFASDQNDAGVWAPIAPRQVVMADLPSVTLPATGGFTADPAYTTVPVPGAPATLGSFPESWIQSMRELGTGPYWHSSGGSTDAFKVPLPLTVGYDAAVAAPTPTPSAGPSKTPKPIDNEVVERPTPTPTATVTVTARPAPAPAPPPVAPVNPPAAAPLPTAAAAAQLPPATQLVALRSDVTSTGAGDESAVGSARLWWAGGVLLLIAALLFSLPSIPRTRKAAP